MHTAPDRPARLPAYSPEAEARRLGVTIHAGPLPVGQTWCIPRHRLVCIDSRITPQEQRVGLTHAVTHMALEGTPLARRLRAGAPVRHQLERAVSRIVFYRLVPLDRLRQYADAGAGLREAADGMNVTEGLLARHIAAQPGIIRSRYGRMLTDAQDVQGSGGCLYCPGAATPELPACA